MSALPLASARLSKLWILCLNDLLDGYLCKNFFNFHISFFFRFSNTILSDALILPVSQLQTQQMMTSEIWFTHRILNTDLLYTCSHFMVAIYEKFSRIGGF